MKKKSTSDSNLQQSNGIAAVCDVSNLLIISKELAIKSHGEVNHLYDGKPYQFHLKHVYEEAMRFEHLIAAKDRENILCACWLHDTMEDCRVSYSQILKATNKEIAEIVYLVTTDKGRTRKDKYNLVFYSELRQNKSAIFVKICDRIANWEYSIEQKSKQATMYKNEYHEFFAALRCTEFAEMFLHLNFLSNQ